MRWVEVSREAVDSMRFCAIARQCRPLLPLCMGVGVGVGVSM